MSEYDTTTDRATTYLNDIRARDRVERSEYDHLINKKRFKPIKRNLKLAKRVENTRDDTLEDILARNKY